MKLSRDEMQMINLRRQNQKTVGPKSKKGNNQKILDLINNRMELGIVKFGQEMPIGFYKDQDILEEVIDAMIYAASLLLELNKEKTNG
tara:strand:- start:383 stop:646 length:264 start_codon:yes stop_codon:yes gene_type:complete